MSSGESTFVPWSVFAIPYYYVDYVTGARQYQRDVQRAELDRQWPA